MAERLPDLGRLGAVLRGAQDATLGRRAVRAGLLSESELSAAGEGGIEVVLRAKGVDEERLRKLREEIDREEFAHLRSGRPAPPEVEAARQNPDRRLAEFVLLERLGQGGLGEVWKAWDTRLGRWVAIKFPAPEPDIDAASRRFTREALAAARLSHPNIVSIHRVDETVGRAFLVMQFIDGQTLGKAKLPLRGALEALRDVAHAVQYAHEQGVIHRDIKPGNIMLGPDGRPFVLDFGLAHLADAGRSASRDGLVAGTAAYMSPEQARGDAAARAPATDVYSLGATLYELATGKAAFSGGSFAETLERVLYHEPAAPRAVDPIVPRDVETVILKAMDKEPRSRYASARAFAEDLDRCLRGDPVAGRKGTMARTIRSRVRRHPRMVLLAGAAIMAVLIAVAFEARLTGREQKNRVTSDRELLRRSVKGALALRRAGANDRMGEFEADLKSAEASDDPETLHLAGRLRRAMLDVLRARDLQDRALARDPSHPGALYERIVLGGSTEEDLDHLRAVASDPAQVRAAEGFHALGMKEIDAARRALEEATSLNPSLEEAWEGLARAWLAGPPSEESCGRAEAAASSGLKLDRGYSPLQMARADARAARARLRRESGKDPSSDFQAAEEDYGEALALGFGPEATAKRAQLRVSMGVHRMELGESPQGPFEAAAKDVQAALARDARSAAALAARAELARRRMELRWAKGENPAEEGKALAARDETAPAEVWRHQAAGRGVLAQWRASRGEDARADFDAALSLVEEALKRAPDERESLELRGRLRLERARAEFRKGREATADLGKAREDLERAGAPLPLARAYRLKGELDVALGADASADLARARELLDVLLKGNPLSAEAWMERGHTEAASGQLLAGDRAAAVEHYTQAVRSFEEARRINGGLEDVLREPLREARRALLGSD